MQSLGTLAMKQVAGRPGFLCPKRSSRTMRPACLAPPPVRRDVGALCIGDASDNWCRIPCTRRPATGDYCRDYLAAPRLVDAAHPDEAMKWAKVFFRYEAFAVRVIAAVALYLLTGGSLRGAVADPSAGMRGSSKSIR